MKVSELIQKLQEFDGNAEIKVALRRGWRPIGDTVPVENASIAFDQDTGKPGYYIDVDLGWDYEMFTPTKEYIEQQKQYQQQREGLYIPEEKENIYTTKQDKENK